jgi:hypothetical protein
MAVALALVLGTRAVADINRLSMHDFYRWRLSTAYAVTREACQAPDAERAGLMAGASGTRLSELSEDPGPELVICTTANINAKRDVRPGQGGFGLAFDARNATLRGRPGAVTECVQASMADYEHLVGHTRLTLFDLVAISGAAVSPLMGSATKVAYRILLTATNVRLGVWLPHPTVVKHARDYLDQKYDEAGRDDPAWSRRPWLLLAWYVLPHPRWHADKKRSERYEARLWAHLLEVREHGQSDQATRRARFGAAACWRIMQPTMGMLWAEAAGHTSYRATWINVTDGGHYDNLGLVEALRREPAHVLTLDASGDHASTWSTLGGSMAAGRPRSGEVCVCKLGWWKGAPWDVVAYAKSHPSYPCEPTLQQLYDSSEFEAYHELGAEAVKLAVGQDGQDGRDGQNGQPMERSGRELTTTLA